MDIHPKDSTASPGAGNSILIVDDTIANLLAYSAILKQLGCRIVLARSGREALRSTLDEDFDVILMDVRMQEMNGFETATLLRQRVKTRAIPIVFMSAYEVPSLHLFFESLGPGVDFILSPVDPEMLRGKVAAALRRSGSEDPVDPSDPKLHKSSSEAGREGWKSSGPSAF